MVELMRLPSRPHEELAANVDGDGVDARAAVARRSGRPVIVTAGHIGNNEAVAAALAHRGYPTNVIADDSTFPEIFELLRRSASLGRPLIPWRNLRELYGVLRRKEILALLVDWGYRSDGIPVRLFGAWTTLPAGPAALAAKTNAWIAPLSRPPHDRRAGSASGPRSRSTSPSSDPADLQRATQRIADCPRGHDPGGARTSGTASSRSGPRPGRGRGARGARRAMLAGRPDPGPSKPPPDDGAPGS